MRISVIGQPGSGKSTLARAISEKLSIPHIHLDRFWFESGGKTGEHDTPHIEKVRALVRERVLEAMRADSWVSDGFHSRLQPIIADKADVVTFLDIPLWVRLRSHVKRVLRPHTRHQELGLWDEIQFFPEMVLRNFSKKPKFEKFIQAYGDKVTILKSWKEIEGYLASLR